MGFCRRRLNEYRNNFFFLEGNHSLFLSKELIPKGSRIMLAYLHT